MGDFIKGGIDALVGIITFAIITGYPTEPKCPPVRAVFDPPEQLLEPSRAGLLEQERRFNEHLAAKQAKFDAEYFAMWRKRK